MSKSPRSVAHDFARFDKIFGAVKNRNQKNSKRTSGANQNIPAAERKSNLILPELLADGPNAINERKPLTQRVDNQSSDKVELLQYFSAKESNFEIAE